MGTTLREKLSQLSPERRARIEAEADRLHSEYMTLQELRKALDKTQTDVAKLLNIKQSSVAQVERQVDIRISTLRHYIEAMGGELTLTVRLPNREPITLTGFSDMDEPPNEHSLSPAGR